jgi:hypothetical protein
MRVLASLCFALVGFGLAACDIIPLKYRARVTVEVDTPQGIRSGSSVVEIRAGKTLALLPQEAKAQVELRGEAVAVELPGGETLFALLRTADDKHSLERVITSALDPSFQGGAEGFLQTVPKLGRSDMTGRSAVIPEESYPVFVRFRDSGDPKSIEPVSADAFAATIGAGFKLRGITVQITEDPVTTGITGKLPPFGKETGFDAWSARLPAGDQRQVSLWDFRRE